MVQILCFAIYNVFFYILIQILIRAPAQSFRLIRSNSKTAVWNNTRALCSLPLPPAAALRSHLRVFWPSQVGGSTPATLKPALQKGPEVAPSPPLRSNPHPPLLPQPPRVSEHPAGSRGAGRTRVGRLSPAASPACIAPGGVWVGGGRPSSPAAARDPPPPAPRPPPRHLPPAPRSSRLRLRRVRARGEKGQNTEN